MTSQDASESDFIDGRIEKKGYRSRWVNAVKKIPSHPYNNGVHMDTHHLISAESVSIAENSQILIQKGYDINNINNLVGFPATLAGACQLHTQLHRGDHIYAQPGEKPYHKFVSSQFAAYKTDIKDCNGKTKSSNEIHQLLDKVSKKILTKINYFELPLTDIFSNFEDKAETLGCVNCFDIVPARGITQACSQQRTHYKNIELDRSGIDFRYQDSKVRGNKKIITFVGKWTPKVGI